MNGVGATCGMKDVVVLHLDQKCNDNERTECELSTNRQSYGTFPEQTGRKSFEEIGNAAIKDSHEYRNPRKTAISHEEMIRVYTQWAKTYDKDLCPGKYNEPEIAASALALHYSEEERPRLKILDVAAGTGRVGQELLKLGFRHIDALEPSPGMLKILMERGGYEKTFENAIGHGRIDEIETDVYDSLVIAGGMGEGHIPVKAVDEMIRIVKPGGTIFIAMREDYLSEVPEYVGKLEPYMNELEKQGLWKQLSRTVVPEYSFKNNGVVFSYMVGDSLEPTNAMYSSRFDLRLN